MKPIVHSKGKGSDLPTFNHFLLAKEIVVNLLRMAIWNLLELYLFFWKI
ncbi:hypothetical protein V6Z12_D06G191500 [Gossypium hirsutum]